MVSTIAVNLKVTPSWCEINQLYFASLKLKAQNSDIVLHKTQGQYVYRRVNHRFADGVASWATNQENIYRVGYSIYIYIHIYILSRNISSSGGIGNLIELFVYRQPIGTVPVILALSLQ